MSPLTDDPTIGSEGAVLRVLHERWTITRDGRTRPTSDSMLDSNRENSCFLESEISLEELRTLFGGRKIARIPVAVVRANGYSLERRPGEAPEGCSSPASHVVCGPPETDSRKDYERKAKAIVTSSDVSIL
jgi:hypothetical protein